MRYIINKSTNPYFNLALDEYAMKNIDVNEDYFILWQNEPSIIIGRNQNAKEQINQDFVDENGIKVARRISGGGAVYHDLGNLNFTFIINTEDGVAINFKKYVEPIIKALESIGLRTYASGRNDILIDGRKISGNAQRYANGRLMHHGTLLFDVDMAQMVKALHVRVDKFNSKSTKSVRARVANIHDYLPPDMTIYDFWDLLHNYLSNNGKDTEIIISEQQRQEIEYEAKHRFETWEWIYGVTPIYNFQNEKRFTGGNVEVFIQVKHGYIDQIKFHGDFLGVDDVFDIEQALVSHRYERDDVEKVLNIFTISDYFGIISVEELLSVIFE